MAELIHYWLGPKGAHFSPSAGEPAFRQPTLELPLNKRASFPIFCGALDARVCCWCAGEIYYTHAHTNPGTRMPCTGYTGPGGSMSAREIHGPWTRGLPTTCLMATDVLACLRVPRPGHLSTVSQAAATSESVCSLFVSSTVCPTNYGQTLLIRRVAALA